MHVHLYERIWMWAATGLIGLFLGAIAVTAVAQAVQPPSHVETVDPETLATHPEFGQPPSRLDWTAASSCRWSRRCAFAPDPIEVPAHVPVVRLTSGDVIHGFGVVGTNANAMAIPGYVSQFTVTFTKPGQCTIACNEYCGLMHHAMVGTVTVK